MTSIKKNNRLLLLGISGMDYKITKGLMAAGRLPSFRKLAEQGFFTKLNPVTPADDNVSWRSLSTGLNPGKHGIFDAFPRNPLTYLPIWPSQKVMGSSATNNLVSFEVKPVWKLISEAGLYTSVTHWPLLSTPLELSMGAYNTMDTDNSMETDNHLNADQKRHHEEFKKELPRQVSELERTQEKAFWQEFSEFKKQDNGFIGFRFDALNQLQQAFWNDRSIGKEGDKITLNKAVAEYYERKDLFLGQILEQIEEPTIVLVVSNHGITSLERSFHLNTWLVEQGYMQLTNGQRQMGKDLFFNYVDWDTTRAYALGFTSIYLNLEQREGQGVVSNKEPLLKELIGKLEQAIDPKNGERVIHKVYRKEDIYFGKYTADAPELIINFKPGYQTSWQTAIGGFGSQSIEDNSKGLAGNHLVDSSFIPGVLFSNRKLERISAHCLDVSPTILDLMGINIPADMDGKSLRSKL